MEQNTDFTGNDPHAIIRSILFATVTNSEAMPDIADAELAGINNPSLPRPEDDMIADFAAKCVIEGLSIKGFRIVKVTN
jgi:hypothetical protein